MYKQGKIHKVPADEKEALASGSSQLSSLYILIPRCVGMNIFVICRLDGSV